MIGLTGLFFAYFLSRRGGRAARWGLLLCGSSALWLYVWSTPALHARLGGALESRFPPQRAEDMPRADAVVLLGGGMSLNVASPYPEMWSAADRVWHAARLYRAGKAPLIIPSGGGELTTSVPLLRDLGVPASAIIVEGQARNTDENARFVADLLRARVQTNETGRCRILLVTSAWHMRRALLNFAQTDLDAIPAAADHEALASRPFDIGLSALVPNAERFAQNSVFLKEYFGYWFYRLRYALLS